MTSVSQKFAQRFPALTFKPFRLFWLAQIVSLTGTWMQNLALPWLVFQLTGSPFLLGLTGTLQFLPQMLLSPFAGTVADHFPKRTMVLITQTVMTLTSALLGVLSFLHLVNYPLILVLALITGLANTLDQPVRQGLVAEIVGRDNLLNAVALNSAAFNGARIFGPAVAGVVMALWGVAWCFTLNALSFLPAIAALSLVPRSQRPRLPLSIRQLLRSTREGLAYVVHRRDLRDVLIAVTLMGVLAFNFSILLPVLVKQTFALGETAFGTLLSAMGLGSLAAAVLLAFTSRRGPDRRLLAWAPLLAGAALVGLGLSRSFPLTLALMVVAGFANIAFFTTANSHLQGSADDAFRGRVISLYTLAFGGMTPFGNFFVGTLAQFHGAAFTFTVTGLLLLVSFGALRVWEGRR